MEIQEQLHGFPRQTPLFPAYSAQKEESKSASNNNQEWLCNSSYTPPTFEEVCIEDVEFSEVKIPVEKTEHHKKKSKLKKDKKKKVAKKHHIPSSEAFFIPEENSIQSQLNKKTFVEDIGLSFERDFKVDKKGDPENIYYEHCGQKNLAKYKLLTRIPIGCSLQEKNSFKLSPVDNSKTVVPRYFSKKAVKLLIKASNEVSACCPFSHESSDMILNFIPLTEKSSIQDQSAVKFEGVSSSWKETPLHLPKSEVMSNANEKTDKIVSESELRSKTVKFNKKVSESPRDIQTWLDFVEFQDELYNAQLFKEGNKSIPESCVIEKKVAILDKALKHNPKSVKLNVAKLNLCRHLWKSDRIISSWEELLFLFPNNVQVWKEYVIFILSNLQYFSTSRILKVFGKCITVLSNLSEGIMKSHAVPPDIISNMLYIFDQLCFIVRHCGYMEKAVALFQSLIEFNLFNRPSCDSYSVSEQITCMEPFWDSGAPRFGEEGAIGWNATIEQKKISFNKLVTESDLNNVEDDILYQKFPEWKTWLEFERLREKNHWLPWRPNPEYDQTFDDIDDADRVVSFDDVSKYIFRIPSEECQFLLIHNFIKFLGFNPHLFGCNNQSVHEMDNQITVDNFDILSRKLCDSLFSEQTSNPLNFSSRIQNIECMDFIKNVFFQSKFKFSSKYNTLLSALWLKYLQCIVIDSEAEKIENVKKIAKTLLKEVENRNCLLLWFEYIKIEYLSGSKSKARKTAQTLFTSSSLAIEHGTMAIKELWYFVRSYIDFSLNIQQDCVMDNELFSHSEIIWLLIHAGSKEKYVPYSNELIKPTMILRASSGFKNFLSQELSAMEEKGELCYCLEPYSYSLIDCAKCFAYLQYFSQDVDAAIQVLKELSIALENKSTSAMKRYILEEICVFQAELLNFHTRNSTVSMKPLLLYLYDSVKEYPNNARLLLILVKWRSASAVVSPTRRFFASLLKEPSKSKPITWFFALASELSISYSLSAESNSSTDFQSYEITPTSMGITWKIWSLYERALNSSTCAYIPIFWRSYMKFEILNNEVEKAKSVFTRALQNCGWSKELIMDGIEYFPEDLKQTLDFMVEKQLRIHTPLEEIKLLMEHGVHNL